MPQHQLSLSGEKETGQVVAFSDGIYSIALTLLMLDVRVPRDLPVLDTLPIMT